jgi:cytochrome b subunit of formate dehydrogenase
VFNRNDLTELVGSIKWFFGFGPRPRYGRYTYWEKFDYFAVFWGMIVIGTSGLMLWFPELFTYILPGRSINIATIIHSDEALLAVAFIFTVHFFNTHFRLDKFPMDPVIFTGRVALDELKYDKPREYEKLVASGRLEEQLVDPFPESVERGFKIFGFIALAVGLTLIFLIILTMLFGYR